MNVRGLMALGALVMVGCDGGGTEPDRVPEILALTGDAALGETVYQTNCAVCHAEDGTGGTGIDLTEHVPNHTDEELVQQALEGGEGMPPFDQLQNQALADLLAYLRETHG